MSAPAPEASTKRPTNLTLSPDRLRFGQQYASAHQTSLSKVVEALLGALENTVTTQSEASVHDPLDGLLADWPAADKKELRKAQHEARLER